MTKCSKAILLKCGIKRIKFLTVFFYINLNTKIKFKHRNSECELKVGKL